MSTKKEVDRILNIQESLRIETACEVIRYYQQNFGSLVQSSLSMSNNEVFLGSPVNQLNFLNFVQVVAILS